MTALDSGSIVNFSTDDRWEAEAKWADGTAEIFPVIGWAIVRTDGWEPDTDSGKKVWSQDVEAVLLTDDGPQPVSTLRRYFWEPSVEIVVRPRSVPTQLLTELNRSQAQLRAVGKAAAEGSRRGNRDAGDGA